jgi:TRAP-type C4-dicarboxylate transport system permease small subunit
MWLDKVYQSLDRGVNGISRVVNITGVSLIMLMMLLITTDVILRYFFDRPLRGVYEIVAIMLVIVVCLAMAYTGIHKGLVAVDILVARFPPRLQALVDIFNSLLGLGLFFLISWKSAEQASIYKAANSLTFVSNLPVYPFVLVVTFGTGLLCLVFLVNLLKSLSRVMKK